MFAELIKYFFPYRVWFEAVGIIKKYIVASADTILTSKVSECSLAESKGSKTFFMFLDYILSPIFRFPLFETLQG